MIPPIGAPYRLLSGSEGLKPRFLQVVDLTRGWAHEVEIARTGWESGG
jgi:hypothetical protein